MAKEPDPVSEEADLVSEFRSRTQDFFSERIEYESVDCLLVSWKDSDLGARASKEIARVSALFDKDFNFCPMRWEIPSHNSQQQLNHQISNFILQHSNHSRTLIIVYYAGHGHADSKEKAVWRAREEGGPIVRLASITQLLTGASGDVLVVLDCCHATLTDGIEKLEGKFEILAATTRGGLAIMPGKFSFTSALIEEFQTGLRKDGFVDIRNAHKSLMAIAATSDIVGTDSIRLKPLKEAEHSGFIRKPVGYIIFRASLEGDLTGLEMARWLKSYCPLNVSAIDIDYVVLQARRLQDLEESIEANTFPSNSFLGQISAEAKMEILGQLHGLNVVMSRSTGAVRRPSVKDDRDMAKRTFEEIHEAVTAACTAAETPLLLETSSSLKPDAVKDDLTIRTIEATNALSLQNCLLRSDGVREDFKLERRLVAVPQTNHRFRYGTFEDKTVLVEAFRYQPDPRTSGPYEQTRLQVNRMSALFHQINSKSFCILPGLGYIEENLHDRFGLVFEISNRPRTAKPTVLLSELYVTEKRVPLEKRLHVALTLVEAVEHLHRLRWLHKELRSDNILFLTSDKEEFFDWTRPWLFGFEYARMMDDGTRLDEDHSLQNNLYRHPARWGKPLVGFTKAHDLYSLGVILLEILAWKPAAVMAKQSANMNSAIASSTHIRPDEFKKVCCSRSCNDLPHLVGQSIADSVLTCLNFDETTSSMNEYEAHVHFQKEVLEKMKRAACGLLE